MDTDRAEPVRDAVRLLSADLAPPNVRRRTTSRSRDGATEVSRGQIQEHVYALRQESAAYYVMDVIVHTGNLVTSVLDSQRLYREGSIDGSAFLRRVERAQATYSTRLGELRTALSVVADGIEYVVDIGDDTAVALETAFLGGPVSGDISANRAIQNSGVETDIARAQLEVDRVDE